MSTCAILDMFDMHIQMLLCHVFLRCNCEGDGHQFYGGMTTNSVLAVIELETLLLFVQVQYDIYCATGHCCLSKQ